MNNNEGPAIEVDGEVENGPDSRARDGGVTGATELARDIETDSRLHQQAASVRDIILSNPRVRVLMVAEAIRSLGAVVQCWNAKAQKYEEKIDHATRLKAVSFLAGYSDGLPVATNLNLNATPNRAETSDEMMEQATPAMIEAMERVIERTKKKMGKKVEVAALPA